jgi:hypothetical protein
VFYYLIFLLISFFSLFDLFNHRYKFHFFSLSVFILFLISALRFGIGLDEDSYRNIYKNISEDYFVGQFSLFNYLQEPLFVFFNILLIPFRSDQSIFFLFASLNAIFLFLSYREYSNYNVLPLLIYYSHRFLHNDLNQIRQGLVSLIFLYSLIYIYRRFFYFINLFGMFIQSGGIIYFLYVSVKKYFSTPKKVVVLLFISLFLSRFLTNDFLFGYIPDFSKILFYLQDERFNYARKLFLDFSFYKSLLIIILLSYHFEALKLKKIHFPILYSVYAFGFFCLIMLHNIAILSGRISSLLFTVEPILVFYLIERFRLFSSRFFIYLIAFIYCIINLYLNLNLENSPVSDYKTFLLK